ncbi:hypothetical protein [Sphingomonas sp. 10B4]|uniref:hypothetical protein n=1 Tax=Sphingomonas sp. 10B4 TaxID=3048575 RepID=UPI002AB4E530|nr:hypothetical protein [Sphingomonas sp. 10B4]MDY7525482.1 hypothetical protein [Sphingomonas sp. 10B4]MEB0281426.1 hypothetical protein [Sphingomonas sp. 10B4]
MVKVQLGDFIFGRFEVPERIPFGASQALTVHKLVGGKRVVDAMGRSPHALAWSGWFIGENALAAARYLKGVCEAGAPVPLTWDELAYTVLIESVDYDYVLESRISYQIRCEVVTDDTAPITDVPPLSVEQLVNDDLDAANALSDEIGDPGLSGLMATLTSAVAAIGDFATAPASTITALGTPIGAARALAEAMITAASGTIGAAPGIAGVALGGDPLAMASAFISQIAVVQNVAPLVGLDRTLGRMAVNVAAMSSGSSSLTLVGGNLFQIAAAQYGDAMDWAALAQANRLTDPVLSGVTTLVIPPKPSSNGGGVLNA